MRFVLSVCVETVNGFACACMRVLSAFRVEMADDFAYACVRVLLSIRFETTCDCCMRESVRNGFSLFCGVSPSSCVALLSVFFVGVRKRSLSIVISNTSSNTFSSFFLLLSIARNRRCFGVSTAMTFVSCYDSLSLPNSCFNLFMVNVHRLAVLDKTLPTDFEGP